MSSKTKSSNVFAFPKVTGGDMFPNAPSYGTGDSLPASPSRSGGLSISLLLARIQDLEVQVETLNSRVGLESDIVVLREISREDAKKEIHQYFDGNVGGVFGYSEIAEALSFDLEVVVELCNELESEKLIRCATK